MGEPLVIDISPAFGRTASDGSTFMGYNNASSVSIYRFAPGAESASEQWDLTHDEYEEFRKKAPELDLPVLKPRALGTNANGNTIGKVVGEAPVANVSAQQANPPVKAEPEAENGVGTKILDGLQIGLDVAGLIPGFGEVADLANAGISAARGDYVGAGLSLAAAVPFAGWGATAAKGVRRGMDIAQTGAEAGAKAGKEIAEETAEQAGKHGDEAAAGSKKGDDGGKVKGDGRDCRLRKYKEGCAGGKTPHHVVPDRAFRMPNGEYFSGGLAHADGYTICVDGGTPVRRGPRANEHGLIHALYDPLEAALGAKGNPTGTATLGELEALGVAAASRVTGCNPIRMAAELRAYHQGKGLSPTLRYRADPNGSMIRGIDPKTIGKGATSGGMGGI